jgi:L-alanine-DL-glutamate epimerase-like enolase superfamily enzyme
VALPITSRQAPSHVPRKTSGTFEKIPIERVTVSSYTVPTSSPESDGTLQWQKTTLVLVTVRAAGQEGLGYSYADLATARLISTMLAEVVEGQDAMSVTAIWSDMVQQARNLGRTSIVAMAISAVDNALWDLKARCLNLPLVTLLGQVREEVEIYGSGGFTSYSLDQLQSQLGGWVREGIRCVKMKIGRDPSADINRIAAAREAIGPEAQLFVDANGAYARKQALHQAEQFARFGVSWFEEPVVADDLEGLRLCRDRAPAVMEIAAGEYGYDLDYFKRMLDAGAVDVLQADATRCSGITGFMQIAALCQAYHVPLSAHCAPALHAHPCCAALPVRHIEYFHDHVRIEKMFFDGVLEPLDGKLRPDLSRPGLGLEFKEKDAVRFRD